MCPVAEPYSGLGVPVKFMMNGRSLVELTSEAFIPPGREAVSKRASAPGKNLSSALSGYT